MRRSGVVPISSWTARKDSITRERKFATFCEMSLQCGAGDSHQAATTMREIVFDTETTGLDPAQGDRLVEIGCIELVNRFPTGKVFHRYLNPERDMPDGAFKIHGLSIEFLKDKPRFAEVVEELVVFIGDDARLVAHNAQFDLTFLNAELKRVGRI